MTSLYAFVFAKLGANAVKTLLPHCAENLNADD